MRKELNTCLAVVTLLFFTACGVTNRLPQQDTIKSSPTASQNESLPAVHPSSYSKVQTSLKKAYDDWKGTPYKWGGTTLHGVDCSAFMQILFNRYLEIELPRTTQKQLYAGTTINRQSLKPGDLIFFKTGRKTLHVGVIVKNKKFLHASTSHGVTISSLKDYYWRSRFLTAKRVL